MGRKVSLSKRHSGAPQATPEPVRFPSSGYGEAHLFQVPAEAGAEMTTWELAWLRCALAAALLAFTPARAQAPPRPNIPDMFDPDHRLPKPDLGAVRTIRFLTTDDFPPFHFSTADGTLTGFDIDLARAICADLKIACTVQAHRFDQLVGEIKASHDDALIAAVANTPATRTDLDFTAPYYMTPARFATQVHSKLDARRPVLAMTPEALAGHTIGVEGSTAHEAFLKTFYPKTILRPYRNPPDLRAAMQNGEVEAIFADGIGLALWLDGSDAKGCCAFQGGPFTESRYFGNGVSIAVGKGKDALRHALDYELDKLTRDGTYADLYLKYFPIGFY